METDIRKISIKLIDGFPNPPFYVFDDDEMSDLTESIRKNDLISPVIVRQKADRFVLISGHRRKHACELLGHDEIACRIVEASDDEAIIRYNTAVYIISPCCCVGRYFHDLV